MSDNGSAILTKPAVKEIRLDFGSGPNPREGFDGVDQYSFDGKVKHVMDIRKRWKWKDATVDEAHASHFVEHLTAEERIRFFNELCRVLKPRAKVTIITPHWCSTRAYGDPTHQWPPVSEMFFFYLNRQWRLGDKEKNMPGNAPHTDISVWDKGYSCDFDFTTGYNLNPALANRAQEYQQFAVSWYKESCMDTICTLTKR